jgi:4a-hydroxytetrahydrobiopterin dehydratase
MSEQKTELANRQCVPCEGGVQPLKPEEARLALTQLHSDWALDEKALTLTRDYRFKHFYQVMSFVNAIAHIANAEDHHPDLSIGYNYCHIRYTTHAIHGLSDNDFICAAKIDRL